jgi:hypothetical protein
MIVTVAPINTRIRPSRDPGSGKFTDRAIISQIISSQSGQIELIQTTILMQGYHDIQKGIIYSVIVKYFYFMKFIIVDIFVINGV